MKNIRKATEADYLRIAEIEIFNYRLNFYPIFRNDSYYFNELSVAAVADGYLDSGYEFWGYDDGAVKGFVAINGREIKKLFVEPVLQGNGIGRKLLEFATVTRGCNCLWLLKKTQELFPSIRKMGSTLQMIKDMKMKQKSIS